VWQQCGGGGGSGGIGPPAATSLAVVMAAWSQLGVSGGSTINNQLKALASTASEMVMMTATMTAIKTKGRQWRRQQLGGSVAAAEVEARQQRQGH
jgi:hypothetical protein